MLELRIIEEVVALTLIIGEPEADDDCLVLRPLKEEVELVLVTDSTEECVGYPVKRVAKVVVLMLFTADREVEGGRVLSGTAELVV